MWRFYPLLILHLLTVQPITGQTLPVDENGLTRQYPQLSLVFNRIFNGAGLDSFYGKFQQVRSTAKGRIHILHIGDSHLQSDHLPGEVRRGLQPAAAGDSDRLQYRTLSINGARFSTFLSSAALGEQLRSLQPDLCIVSLGTNDAMLASVNESELRRDLDRLQTLIRQYSPSTALLFTTAADSFKIGQSNRELLNVNLILVAWCNENRLPVWDLYYVTNGIGSAYRWSRQGLLSADGIHFTATAYRLQGRLLYNALAKGYNNYISGY